ncbi:MAG: TMEM43 family protein [Proteobacteria bacterium]|nr:TMEM43 family protein [Pseudomonadota bacterium]
MTEPDKGAGAGEFREGGVPEGAEEESWLERLGDSIGAVILGVILVLGSGSLLFWNESRAVDSALGFAEGSSALTVPADRIDPDNDGRLVHVVGMLTTSGPAADFEFGMKSPGARLRRIVEMFQWSEEAPPESGNGGGPKTYSYTRRWSDRPIESDDFHEWRGHANPLMPYRTHLALAPGPRLGAFIVPPNLLYQFGSELPLPAGEEQAALLQRRLGRPVTLVDGTLYVGSNPAQPEIGDLRITFRHVPLQKATVVAEQAGRTFEAFHPRAGGPIEVMAPGEVAASKLFKVVEEEGDPWPWIIRAGGCLMMFVGFVLVIGPISSLADVVPILIAVVEAGVAAVGLFFTVVVAPLIAAAAWVMYRPVIAAAVLAAGAILAAGALWLAHWHKAKKEAAAV